MIAEDKSNEVHLVGSWRTLIGDMDTYGMNLEKLNSIDFCCPSQTPTRFANSLLSTHLGIQGLPRVSPHPEHGAR
jgi:hypothetical protein